ncbi:hypothetical protein K0M31_014257 [Melipona bicolor]|uniref:Uncharacterized protein n=1 Tax=Melipona bicolor TaxID=60889 RepID=A0AA40G886_9HYME|nr:hypothetical protein K0M31_014257 [Melipona bicolor]
MLSRGELSKHFALSPTASLFPTLPHHHLTSLKTHPAKDERDFTQQTFSRALPRLQEEEILVASPKSLRRAAWYSRKRGPARPGNPLFTLKRRDKNETARLTMKVSLQEIIQQLDERLLSLSFSSSLGREQLSPRLVLS